MIQHIPLLIESEIASFKIEGRMRDPQYISETVECYRQAIDAYYENDFTREKVDYWMARVKKVFNRGFHTGFYFSQPGPKDIQKDLRGNGSEWHRDVVGRVVNYYKKAKAIEIELTSGRLSVGQQVIFENQADHFSTQKISSLQLDNETVDETPYASSDNHIVVGMKVKEKVPINSMVFVFKKRNEEV